MNSKNLLRLAGIAALAFFPQACLQATIVHADFNDLNLGLISGQGGGTGFGASLWGAGASTPSLSNAIVSGDLNAPLSTGNSLTQADTAQSVQGIPGATGSTNASFAAVTRVLDTPLSGTIWFSVLFNLEDSSGRAGLNLNRTDAGSGAGHVPRIVFVGNGTFVVNALGNPAPIGTTVTIPGFTLGTPMLALGKISIDVSGASDLLSLWFNPNVTGGEAGLGTPAINSSANNFFGTSITSVGLMSWHNGTGTMSPGKLDHLTLSDGTNAFLDVTSLTEPSAPAQEARFFRIVAPWVTAITSVSPDGTITWTNAGTGSNCVIQTATTLVPGDWVAYLQVLVTNSVMTLRIFDPTPVVVVWPAPAGAPVNTNYTVTAGVSNSPVYSVIINSWFRNHPRTDPPSWDTYKTDNETAGFTAFESSGLVPVAVRFNDRTVTNAQVYPSRHGVIPTITGGNTVNFLANGPGKYIVMINGTEVRPCHIFIHPIDTNIPSVGPNVTYYGPGNHNIGTVTVTSGKTYYIAGGARVIGAFVGHNKTNFTIRGRGIIESSPNFLLADNAKGFTVEGITIIRPYATTSDWTFKPRGCENFLIDGINVFTCEIVRDGIDSSSCRNYEIRNCFIRSSDDPFCINAAWAGYGDITNAYLHDCVLMPDNGIGGTEIGASMESAVCRDVTYERIDMVHPHIHSAISIYNADYADIHNITYRDIRIENFHGTVGNSMCVRMHVSQSAFSAVPYVPGHIHDVHLYDVTFTNTDAPIARKFLFTGYDATHKVSGIHWHNLWVDGVRITNASQLTVTTNTFAEDITFD